MTRYPHTLRIMGASAIQIREEDPDLWAEIERDRAEGDTDDDAILRWLGDLLSETEDALNSLLPLDWYVKIEEGKVESDD